MMFIWNRSMWSMKNLISEREKVTSSCLPM